MRKRLVILLVTTILTIYYLTSGKPLTQGHFKKDADFYDQIQGKFDEICRENIPTSTIEVSFPNFDDNLINYSPKFSIATLLSHLTKQYNSKFKIPVFHWSDYVDLTDLNGVNALDCTDFNGKPINHDFLNPLKICIDDNDITKLTKLAYEFGGAEMSLFKSKIRLASLLKNNHKFHLVKNGGKLSSNLKTLQAKSYVYDFMPPPLTMTFMVNEKSMRFYVLLNEINRKKLIDSSLVQESSKSLNYSRILQDFYQSLPGVNEPINQYSPHVNLEQFLDNSPDYSANSIPKSFDEIPYYHSLHNSLHTDLDKEHEYFHGTDIIDEETGSENGQYYDWRFFRKLPRSHRDQIDCKRRLIRAWLKFTRLNGFINIPANESLLSWYWNGMSFPWASTIDFQMPIRELHKMSHWYNQSLIFDLGAPENPNFGKYFLDVGPYITHRTKGLNNVDARFIDVDSGLFIDISGLSKTNEKLPDRYSSGNFNVYNSRNNQFLSYEEITPLKMSIFEGEYCLIPHKFQEILSNEFGELALTAKTKFGYTFISKLNLWIDTLQLHKYIENTPTICPTLMKTKGQFDINIFTRQCELYSKYQNEQIPEAEYPFNEIPNDDEYMNYLFSDINREILIEFLATYNITNLHDLEMHYLHQKDEGASKKLFFSHDELLNLRLF